MELSRPQFVPLRAARGGDSEAVSPPLLLRDEPIVFDQATAATLALAAEDPDNVGAARGIIAGIGMAAGCWVAFLAALAWWF
jgi:hypothetical protein